LNATLAECGRCGVFNPEDAEFCQSCGALLAAYRAPRGATETILLPSAEVESPASSLFIPPSRDSLADYESPTTPIAVATTQTEAEVELPPPAIAEVIAAPAGEPTIQAPPIDHQQESTWHAAARTTEEDPANKSTARVTSKTNRAQSKPVSNGPLPIPESYRSFSGRNMPNPRAVYQQTRRSMSAKQNSTPQLLIFAGIAAFLLAFFIGIAAGSAISIVLLFLGGPLGFGLIMAGVLMLIGRHPTGRP